MNTLRQSPARNQQSDYRPDIDGVRAIAVLAVVLFHAGIPLVKGGFIGVDIFFVISGLLIGSHVYSDIRAATFRISNFYAKRAKRILPALLAVLAACCLIALAILSPRELKSFGGYVVATLLSGSNILAWFKADYFAAGADQNPLLMTWSLGVEEQFYILFPLLMLLMARARRKTIFLTILAIAVLSIALSIVGTSTLPTATFYLLPTRAWEIAAGVLMAIYQDGRNPRTLYANQRFADLASIAGLGLIVASIVLFNSRTPFPGAAALLPVCGTMLLLSAPGSIINRLLLSSAPFTFIGGISYSLYLWHWPLLSFAHILSDRPLTVSMGCAIAALSAVPAWLSYRFIEQPFRRSKTPTATLLLRYGVIVACAIIPGVVFEASRGLPGRFHDLSSVESSLATAEYPCLTSASPIFSSTCFDTRDPRPAIAVLGDSHAASAAPAIRMLAEKKGYKVYEFTKSSCAPLVGVTRILATMAEEHGCVTYNAQVLSLIEKDPNIKKVVITAYWAGPEIDQIIYRDPDAATQRWPYVQSESYASLEQGLGGTISALQRAGKQVILVKDVPTFKFDPIRHIWARDIPMRRLLVNALFPAGDLKGTAPLSETFATEDANAEAAITAVAQHQNVPLFDPRINLCADGQCSFMEGETALYVDKQHVSVIGAEKALTGLPL